MDNQPTPFIDKNRTFELPASLGLALQARRGELVKMTITEVKNGAYEIDGPMVIELLTLIANLISDVQRHESLVYELEMQLEEIGEFVETSKLAAGQALSAFKNADSLLHRFKNPEEDDE